MAFNFVESAALAKSAFMTEAELADKDNNNNNKSSNNNKNHAFDQSNRGKSFSTGSGLMDDQLGVSAIVSSSAMAPSPAIKRMRDTVRKMILTTTTISKFDGNVNVDTVNLPCVVMIDPRTNDPSDKPVPSFIELFTVGSAAASLPRNNENDEEDNDDNNSAATSTTPQERVRNLISRVASVRAVPDLALDPPVLSTDMPMHRMVTNVLDGQNVQTRHAITELVKVFLLSERPIRLYHICFWIALLSVRRAPELNRTLELQLHHFLALEYGKMFSELVWAERHDSIHDDKRDTVLKLFPSICCQTVYFALTKMFPQNKAKFDMSFKRRILRQVTFWMTGVDLQVTAECNEWQEYVDRRRGKSSVWIPETSSASSPAASHHMGSKYVRQGSIAVAPVAKDLHNHAFDANKEPVFGDTSAAFDSSSSGSPAVLGSKSNSSRALDRTGSSSKVGFVASPPKSESTKPKPTSSFSARSSSSLRQQKDLQQQSSPSSPFSSSSNSNNNNTARSQKPKHHHHHFGAPSPPSRTDSNLKKSKSSSHLIPQSLIMKTSSMMQRSGRGAIVFSGGGPGENMGNEGDDYDYDDELVLDRSMFPSKFDPNADSNNRNSNSPINNKKNKKSSSPSSSPLGFASSTSSSSQNKTSPSSSGKNGRHHHNQSSSSNKTITSPLILSDEFAPRSNRAYSQWFESRFARGRLSIDRVTEFAKPPPAPIPFPLLDAVLGAEDIADPYQETCSCMHDREQRHKKIQEANRKLQQEENARKPHVSSETAKVLNKLMKNSGSSTSVDVEVDGGNGSKDLSLRGSGEFSSAQYRQHSESENASLMATVRGLNHSNSGDNGGDQNDPISNNNNNLTGSDSGIRIPSMRPSDLKEILQPDFSSSPLSNNNPTTSGSLLTAGGNNAGSPHHRKQQNRASFISNNDDANEFHSPTATATSDPYDQQQKNSNNVQKHFKHKASCKVGKMLRERELSSAVYENIAESRRDSSATIVDSSIFEQQAKASATYSLTKKERLQRLEQSRKELNVNAIREMRHHASASLPRHSPLMLYYMKVCLEISEMQVETTFRLDASGTRRDIKLSKLSMLDRRSHGAKFYRETAGIVEHANALMRGSKADEQKLELADQEQREFMTQTRQKWKNRLRTAKRLMTSVASPSNPDMVFQVSAARQQLQRALFEKGRPINDVISGYISALKTLEEVIFSLPAKKRRELWELGSKCYLRLLKWARVGTDSVHVVEQDEGTVANELEVMVQKIEERKKLDQEEKIRRVEEDEVIYQRSLLMKTTAVSNNHHREMADKQKVLKRRKKFDQDRETFFDELGTFHKQSLGDTANYINEKVVHVGKTQEDPTEDTYADAIAYLKDQLQEQRQINYVVERKKRQRHSAMVKFGIVESSINNNSSNKGVDENNIDEVRKQEEREQEYLNKTPAERKQEANERRRKASIRNQLQIAQDLLLQQHQSAMPYSTTVNPNSSAVSGGGPNGKYSSPTAKVTPNNASNDHVFYLPNSSSSPSGSMIMTSRNSPSSSSPRRISNLNQDASARRFHHSTKTNNSQKFINSVSPVSLKREQRELERGEQKFDEEDNPIILSSKDKANNNSNNNCDGNSLNDDVQSNNSNSNATNDSNNNNPAASLKKLFLMSKKDKRVPHVFTSTKDQKEYVAQLEKSFQQKNNKLAQLSPDYAENDVNSSLGYHRQYDRHSKYHRDQTSSHLVFLLDSDDEDDVEREYEETIEEFKYKKKYGSASPPSSPWQKSDNPFNHIGGVQSSSSVNNNNHNNGTNHHHHESWSMSIIDFVNNKQEDDDEDYVRVEERRLIAEHGENKRRWPDDALEALKRARKKEKALSKMLFESLKPENLTENNYNNHYYQHNEHHHASSSLNTSYDTRDHQQQQQTQNNNQTNQSPLSSPKTAYEQYLHFFAHSSPDGSVNGLGVESSMNNSNNVVPPTFKDTTSTTTTTMQSPSSSGILPPGPYFSKNMIEREQQQKQKQQQQDVKLPPIRRRSSSITKKPSFVDDANESENNKKFTTEATGGASAGRRRATIITFEDDDDQEEKKKKSDSSKKVAPPALKADDLKSMLNDYYSETQQQQQQQHDNDDSTESPASSSASPPSSRPISHMTSPSQQNISVARFDQSEFSVSHAGSTIMNLSGVLGREDSGPVVNPVKVKMQAQSSIAHKKSVNSNSNNNSSMQTTSSPRHHHESTTATTTSSSRLSPFQHQKRLPSPGEHQRHIPMSDKEMKESENMMKKN